MAVDGRRWCRRRAVSKARLGRGGRVPWPGIENLNVPRASRFGAMPPDRRRSNATASFAGFEGGWSVSRRFRLAEAARRNAVAPSEIAACEDRRSMAWEAHRGSSSTGEEKQVFSQ